jgi:TRAP transporter 4TM/12TM fusion protein
MAEMLNIPYAQIAGAAILPALLYFLTLWFSVGFHARRKGIKPLDRAELPAWRELIDPYTSLPMYLPVGTLVLLLVMDFTPTLAGAASVATLVISLLILRTIKTLKESGVSNLVSTYMELTDQVLDGLYKAGRAIAMIAVLLACAAIVVKVLTATGAGVKVSGVILSLSGENLTFVLLLTAVLSILLGMDVPTTASYILASAIAAPIVINLGIPELNAHLFVFYYAILSAITPPVCASVFAAASIANVSFWRVSGHAVVLAIALYAIPFLFIYRPGVLMEGSALTIIYDAGIAILAVMAIAAASTGYLLSRLDWIQRIALYTVAALLFYTAAWSDIVGAALLLGITTFSYWQGRRQTVQQVG